MRVGNRDEVEDDFVGAVARHSLEDGLLFRCARGHASPGKGDATRESDHNSTRLIRTSAPPFNPTNQRKIKSTRCPVDLARNDRAGLKGFEASGGNRRDAIDPGKLPAEENPSYAIWSERNASRVTEFANLMHDDSDVKGLTLWVDGSPIEPRRN